MAFKFYTMSNTYGNTLTKHFFVGKISKYACRKKLTTSGGASIFQIDFPRFGAIRDEEAYMSPESYFTDQAILQSLLTTYSYHSTKLKYPLKQAYSKENNV